MSIFNKWFSGQPQTPSGSNADRVTDVLAKADLMMARDEIADMHRMWNAEAAQQGGEYIFPVEYANAWKAFRDNPTITTARALLESAPPLIMYFEMCSPGHNFYANARYLKGRGL